MKFTAINSNSDFVRGYRKGRCYVSGLVVVYVRQNRYGYTRIGITSSKKIGKAVVRNRARRVIREAVRQLGVDMSQSVDLIFVSRGRTAGSKSWQVQSRIKNIFEKAGVRYGQTEPLQ